MPEVNVTMTLKKETPGTYVFENQDSDAITQLYIKKGVFPNGSPALISVKVSDLEPGNGTG